jgi:integrase/recombinase XerC
MEQWLTSFINYLKVQKNYSTYTLDSYNEDILFFKHYLDDHRLNYQAITYQEIKGYLMLLNEHKYTKTSISRKLSSLRSFYKYLSRQGVIKENPFLLVSSPKKDRKLPTFLYYNQLEKVFDEADLKTAMDKLNSLKY